MTTNDSSTTREYRLNIDPRILELLGPSLYTNIYYILAELIANAYDADARNVYIIFEKDAITVEDDGLGMSYAKGEVTKYLNVASSSRHNDTDSFTPSRRMKMGRKGVGKLAALSVSENVAVKTISQGEKAGFILSRHVGPDHELKALKDEEITFRKITDHGTSVVMLHPQYTLPKAVKTVRRNLLKIFPQLDQNFRIHLYLPGQSEDILDYYDTDLISEMATLITFGEDFNTLSNSFTTEYATLRDTLCVCENEITLDLEMTNLKGEIKSYPLKIRGWIGTFKRSSRKNPRNDFPDNFISLYAHQKMGEFNILPFVSINRLNEVYIRGQLHVDLFELTELPDMALSNRQGYRGDDPRYQAVLECVRTRLMPRVLTQRQKWTEANNRQKDEEKRQRKLEDEKKFRTAVENFREDTASEVAEQLVKEHALSPALIVPIQNMVDALINKNSPKLGIKKRIDSQKKKILISHTEADKALSDAIFEMLRFNGVPDDDIIYTHGNDRTMVPLDRGIFDYLREFFVDSYSTQKLCVLFVTSKKAAHSWGVPLEMGAAWITQMGHYIFNVDDFRPQAPLDDRRQWHQSFFDANRYPSMNDLNANLFCQIIEHVCKHLGYPYKSRDKNLKELAKWVTIS